MFLYTDKQITYIVLASILCLAILIMFLFPLFRRISYRRSFKRKYYSVINKLVLDEDYLLINNFIIKNLNLKIDHIIFANKYIYLIKDEYFEGAIEGKIRDNKLIYYPYKKRDVLTVNNPYIKLKEDYENIVRLAGINSHFFKLITLINDDVLINMENTNIQNFYICSKSNLKNTILDIEKSAKVKDFNQNELIHAAKDIARINERKKK